MNLSDLPAGDRSVAKREIENIRPGDKLGKNHKILREENGYPIYQKSSGSIRIQYTIDNNAIEIVDVFKKKNHRTTNESKNNLNR